MRFLHAMLRVHSLERALDFFCGTLGFIETKRYENAEGRFTLVFLAAPEDLSRAQSEKAPPLLELTYNWPAEEQSAADIPPYTIGRNFGHLAYAVKDIYAICTDLMEKGILLNRPPRDGRMAFIRSPDGISLELLQEGPPLPLREPWISMESQGEW